MELDEILIITDPKHLDLYKNLLGDGKKWNLSITYETQSEPRGLAEALIIGEKFINGDSFALILGDNFIFSKGLYTVLSKAKQIHHRSNDAIIFTNPVNNPQSFGIAEYDKSGKLVRLIEKPVKTNSNQAIIGLYIYPNHAVKIAKSISPSDRGEIEITSVNQKLLEDNQLKSISLGRGTAWLDTGTFDDLLEASSFVKIMYKRQGLNIGCIEEVLLNTGRISLSELKGLIDEMPLNNEYSNYLLKVISQN